MKIDRFEGMVVISEDDFDNLCYNFDENERQLQFLNSLYGNCLMEINLLKDEIERLKQQQWLNNGGNYGK